MPIKRAFATCLLSLAILVGAVTTVTVSGCKSPTVQKQAVNTITTVGETVKFTLDGYLDLVVKGTLSTNGVPKVLKAYGEFQAAYNSALVVVLGNTNSVAPQSLMDSAAAFSTTVTTTKKGGP